LLKKLLRFLALILLPFFGSIFIKLLFLSHKKIYHTPKTITDEPLIFACWHGELLFLAPFYTKYRKIVHAQVLISNHFDGAFISKTIQYFGLGTLAGSSNKNAVKVLIQAIKALKNGYDIGITPDGPKGPRHEVADGIIVMAQKTRTKIVLIEIKPTAYWQVDSWDKFMIPKPFATTHFYASSEIDVCDMELEEAREHIKKGLLKHEN